MEILLIQIPIAHTGKLCTRKPVQLMCKGWLRCQLRMLFFINRF